MIVNNVKLNKGKNNMFEEFGINGSLVKKVVVGVLGLVVLLGSYSIVPPGHKGIVIHMGKTSDTVLDEGFTLKIPFVTTVKSVSTRIQETSIQTEAASKDMQTVHTVLSLNWHISPDKVNTVFKRIGEADVIENNIIQKQVSEVLKAATALMSAEEILARRNELKIRIDNDLIQKLAVFDLTVDNVNLSDFKFEPEFNHAVEQKQIAEQRAKQAEYEAQKAEVDARATVNKAKGDALATLTRAKAEAESNALKLKTLTPELIRYETIQRWDGKLPQVQSGNAGSFISVDLNKKKSDD